MCYPKPGPRCAPHAKTELQQISLAKEKAEISGDAHEIARLEKERERVWMEFYGTSQGQQFLLRKAERYDAEGNHSEAALAREVFEEAVEYRKNQIESLKRRQAMMTQGKPHGPVRGAGIRKVSHILKSRSKDNPDQDGTPSSTNGYGLVISKHAFEAADSKGFTEAEMCETFARPERIYPSGSHPGQHRITGNGLCLVGRFRGSDFQVITVFLDGVVTKPREDQLKTREGQEYSQRWREHGYQARKGTKAKRSSF